MASAAAPAPAPESKLEKTTETTETCEAQPVTLKHRIKELLCKIFEGREEHLGLHQ
jgi:hypothetical protein